MYEKYDEYDAINVDKCADIPWNYDGLMGVPITIMCNNKYDGLYEIVDLLNGDNTKVNGKCKYARIIIRSNLANAFIINPTINGIPLSERDK